MQKLTATDIPVRDFPIDEMPQLSTRLGKAGTDRIRYHQRGANTTPLAKSKNIPNTLQAFMQDKRPGDPGCWVDDIVQGIARLDHQQTKHRSPPLSVERLYALLQCLELINTREVMAMLQVDKRQAQKYVKALQLILVMIHRHLSRIQQSVEV